VAGMGRRERSPTTSGTVGYLLSRWLEVADLELTTRDGYESYIRRNILPALGDVPLRKLDTELPRAPCVSLG
jgi:integrase